MPLRELGAVQLSFVADCFVGNESDQRRGATRESLGVQEPKNFTQEINK
jgi:hypothetical protein